MTNKKKIALLNFPVDGNFGGHLQRYALMEVLRAEGADVTHLNCRYLIAKRSVYKQVKRAVKEALRFAKGLLTGKRNRHDLPYLRYLLRRDPKTERFYERYVPHTKRIYSNQELAKYSDYDAYVVGSDQVWRAPMAAYNYGIEAYFFDYLPAGKKRYAYGVSLGTKEKEYTDEQIARLTPLYKTFEMVSARENSAMAMFDEYGWTEPKAECVLDPTFLLDKTHYERLVKGAYTKKSNGNMFCYVLDEDEEKKAKIEQIAKEWNLRSYSITLKDDSPVEQWLRSFMEAEFVVTDSYHGFVFALIFNKPFRLLYNETRGNARFEHLLQLLNIKGDDTEFDWKAINAVLKKEKEKSLNYIRRICEDQ